MTRRTLALGLVVLTLVLHAGDAVARARGGGSRGSRSFSRPVAPPASPATPSSPSRSSSSLAQPRNQPPASRGFFGPLAGGLAGFALGGLVGGFLFGRGAGSGIGLMDLALIGGALYLLYRVMAARRGAQPASAAAGGYGGAHADDVGEPDGGAVAASPAASELERGLAHIRQMDPSFEPHTVADAAHALFGEVQRGITARDVRALGGRLTPRMYAELTGQCDRLRAARRTNRVERVALRRSEATEAWQEAGQDYLTVYLAGSLVDYTVDDASGAVVEGERVPQDFEEYWTFARPVGPNGWKLSAIQTA